MTSDSDPLIPVNLPPTSSIPVNLPPTSSIPVNQPMNHSFPGSSSTEFAPMTHFPRNSNTEPFSFDGIQYSPYYLTNGDNPGAAIISETLDGTNYNTWNIAITIALDAKNKLAFVDGSLPRPRIIEFGLVATTWLNHGSWTQLRSQSMEVYCDSTMLPRFGKIYWQDSASLICQDRINSLNKSGLFIKAV